MEHLIDKKTSKLTPIGISLRKLRIDLGISMGQMADQIRMSKSLLSGIETGRKSLSRPEQFVDSVVSTYDIGEEGKKHLECAICCDTEEYSCDLTRVKSHHRYTLIKKIQGLVKEHEGMA